MSDSISSVLGSPTLHCGAIAIASASLVAHTLTLLTLLHNSFPLKGRIPPWPASWSDIGILIWLEAVWMLSIAWALGSVFTESAWGEIAGLLVAQSGMAAIALLWRASMLSRSAPLSPSRLGLGKSLAGGAFAIIFSLIPVYAASHLGVLALEWLNTLGAGFDIGHQSIISVFAGLENALQFAAITLLVVVGAPVAEELVFRAGLYRGLKNRMPPSAAMLASSILFALLHSSAMGFAPLVALGILLSALYEIGGDIKPCIFFHALFNLNSMALLFLS